jgi:dTDP-4-amino-4,6-dideoxygalactose transaminase
VDCVHPRSKGPIMIYCGNPRAQYIAHKEEIDEVVDRVLNRGRYILGEETSNFEKEFSHYIGVQFSIGVGSGTEALHLALAACHVSRGDEVITVSHTAVATISAIELVGAYPVFADIEPDYYTMNPYVFEELITPRTKAVIPVHIYGQPASLEPILEIAKRHNLYVIEDCAQAHGAMYKGEHVGSWGDIGCFSFYPTKNLGAIGDGGIVATDNEVLANQVKLLREYGWKERFKSDIPGWNSRLDEIQAAILRIKLKYLDKDNETRTQLAVKYSEEFKHCRMILPKLRPDSTHVYHQFVIRYSQRDTLQKFLEEQGIRAQIHYPIPIHQQRAYRNRLKIRTDLTVTERITEEILSLPIYPELTEGETNKIITAVKDFFN